MFEHHDHFNRKCHFFVVAQFGVKKIICKSFILKIFFFFFKSGIDVISSKRSYSNSLGYYSKKVFDPKSHYFDKFFLPDIVSQNK